MARDGDIEKFKQDAIVFGISVAGYVTGVGKLLVIRDTYQKGRRLANSAPPAFYSAKRRVKNNILRRLRGLL